MTDFDFVKIGDVSKYRREFIEISDTEEYKRCRVQLHKKGVILRDVIKGKDIKTKKQRLCKINDFIVAEMDAKFGGYGIIPQSLNRAIVSSHYYLFEIDQNKILPDYFKVLIDTNVIQSQIKAKGTTNYSRVSPKEIMDFEIPFPSLDIQEKIVIKYISSKKHIINILKEFDYQQSLFKQLRQAILQEAVEGKLTAAWRNQHPELISGENHAARLLEKIKAEKALRQAQGKKRKEKPLPPVTDAEKHFDLPEGWVCLYLNDISIKVQDGTHYSPQKQYKSKKENTFLYITSKNIKDDGIKTNNATYIDAHVHKKIYERCNPEFGDLLIIKDGAVTGRVTLNNLKEEFSILSSVAFVKTDNKNINNRYLMHYLRSPMGQEQIVGRMTGAAITRIILRRLQNTVIPFPPLREQQAIVEKVDRLMAKIDALEEQIKYRKAQAEQLMQAVLREAFNGAE